MLTKTELYTWLILLYASVSARAVIQALKTGRPLEKLLSITVGELLSLGLSNTQIHKLKHPDLLQIEKDLAWLKMTTDCEVVTLLDPRYPSLLLEIVDPPILLFVKGDVDLLKVPQLAIIGSRQASPQGRDIAFDYAKALASSGLVITSGLAIGIDGQAHQGALVSGKTIAVLGTGLEMIYPRQHLPLSRQIMQAGALVSEFPPYSPPLSAHFPKRNRIISGLSLGVLVVEASLRSGSLITAKLALEQGREVFAIPGSIYNSMAKGCHELIRNGAKLIDNMDDILNELPRLSLASCREIPPKKRKTGKNAQVCSKNLDFFDKPTAELDKVHQSLLDCIDDGPTSIEIIINRSTLTNGEICAMLSLLESQNLIARLPGGYQKLGKS